MILVVGLVVAGLAGIAAAFYFSIRSGRRGDKHNSRARSARGAGRLRAGASAADTGPGRPGNGSRVANGGRAVNARRANQASADYKDDTGPNSTMDFGELDLSGDRRPAGSRRPEADLRSAPAMLEADADDAADVADEADGSRTARTRRRVGFRKGADVDEELWPTESFGGVSDEQFWDDMASDKPLTTTARAAQQDSGRRGGQAARRIEPRGRDETPRPPAAADQNLVQAGYGATQPVAPLKPAASPRSAAAQPTATPPTATPLKPVGGTGPLPRSARPPGAVNQPGEGWRQTGPSAEDDPLTSSAFSLREAGPVDGRSLRSAGPSRGGEYQPSTAEVSQPLAPGDTGNGGYLPSPPAPRYLPAGYGTAPYETPSYGNALQGPGPQGPGPLSTGRYGNAPYGSDPDRTPPNADTYGYRSPGPLDEPRRPNAARPNGAPPNGAPPNGARPGARHAGPDDRGRPARPPYPPQAGQPGGGRHQSGANQNGANQSGGYQANGYPDAGRRGGGQRPPYDPRDDYRRLTPHPLTPSRRMGANRRAGANRGAGAGR